MSDINENKAEDILIHVEESKVIEEAVDICVTENGPCVTENGPCVTENGPCVTQESKPEIENNVVGEIVQITFSQILENFLNQNANKLNELSVNINPTIQTYFLLLCKEQPDFFKDIESSLKKIILDNKIDTKDIPEIILLVTKAYQIIKSDKGVPQIDPYELIKTLLHLVFIQYIETNKVQNKDLLNEILKIIDVSIDLIKLKAIEPPKVGCLKSIFNC